jgi:hypothetical protein
MSRISALVTGVAFAIGLLAQGGIVCPDRSHANGSQHGGHHHAGMPMHTSDTAPTPAPPPSPPPCCWTAATCTSPAAPASWVTASEVPAPRHHVGAGAAAPLRSLSFAPETPPPRV